MRRSKLYLVILSTIALAIGGAACGKDKKSQRSENTEPDKPPVDQPPTDKPPTDQPPVAADGTGTISGSVKFTGTAPEMPALKREADPFCAKTPMNAETVVVNENGTLRNVLVRIKPGTVKGAAPAEAVKVGQDNCMYRPRVQGAQPDQELVIANGDPTTHNVHAFDMTDDGEENLFNLAQPQGAPSITKDTNGYTVMKLKCDVHPWMLGYVVVTDHPFFAVTGEDGAFKLENVPAGKHTVEAWHEHYGLKTAEVTVAKDSAADAAFTYDAAEKPL